MPPCQYTPEEEFGNTLTHSVGALICAFLFGFFAHKMHVENISILASISYYIFAFTSIFVLITSSLYHAISNKDVKPLLKKYDHIAIYYLIAGTYIPLAVNLIVPNYPIIGWSFIILQLMSAVCGTMYKLLAKNKYGYASVIFYCVIGWSILPFLGILSENIPTVAMHWLVIGGFFYMLGVPFYVLKQYKWTHVIWHVLVVFGIVCHYVMMFYI